MMPYRVDQYLCGLGDGGTRGHVGALFPATTPMVPGREYVDYDTKGEGGLVSERLHIGDGSLSLWKRLHSET